MLSDLIEKKQELEKQSKREIPEGTFNALGILGVIKRAQLDLEMLKNEYVNEARKQAVLVVATGTKTEDFASLSKEEFGCFVVDGEELYKNMSLGVNDAYLGQGSSQTILNLIQAKLEELAYDIGVQSMPYMVMKHEDMVDLRTREDVDLFAKTMINKHIGAEINSLFIMKKAGEMAYTSDFKGKILPIVVLAKDENLAKELLNNSSRVIDHSFLVKAGDSNLDGGFKLEEIDSKKVEKVFVNIKKSVK